MRGGQGKQRGVRSGGFCSVTFPPLPPQKKKTNTNHLPRNWFLLCAVDSLMVDCSVSCLSPADFVFLRVQSSQQKLVEQSGEQHTLGSLEVGRWTTPLDELCRGWPLNDTTRLVV